ncbi:uncharacterized protein MELLADRAFT_68403 [Melampsora larici-populina 98AG31]|uniref:Uncharacterized protein n=1 Tax=Melampsora larici-populina (strain 98AG31 / pathotype 3-4-7) TaxID=747676 RepID=F4S6P1_MELLP|nr:uncharacterized protein MELLADRAFT_68403 [Melampsora larici-populina 98AG31]EGF99723.1 hypothetical protein MELLADRAFT_68403 [Melampsora larici-populina 98AG31]
MCLLTGIHDPKTGEAVEQAVPTIRSLMQRLSVRCATVGTNCHVDAVWAATDLPTRAQIAYLRREAARIVLKGGKGSESIWACVDKQLSTLRLRNDELYTVAYFDGNTYFQDLKEKKVNLDLPLEEAILARVAHNAAHPQGAPNPSNMV